LLIDYFAQEGNMEDPFTTAVKQAIQDRYKQKYGRVTIDLDEVVTAPPSVIDTFTMKDLCFVHVL